MQTQTKNILIVAPNLSAQRGGGIATSVMSYYEALNRQKNVGVTVVATISPGEKDFIGNPIKQIENIIFFRTNAGKWRYSKELKQYLKDEIQKYDIVWAHGVWLSQTYLVSRYAIKHHIPYIISPHGSLNPRAAEQKKIKKNIYWYLLGKRIFFKAAAIHCLTNTEEKTVKKASNNRTFVLSNTIAAGAFESKVYGELDHVCFIGRFHHNKGLDLLLEAFSDIPNINLLVAGNGEKTYEEYIVSLVTEYNLEDRVTFIGFADNALKKEIFKQSLFCIIPSHFECMAMVGLESIAHSTPVLATKQCDFEIIEECDAGIVIDSNQPEVIREGIRKMMAKDIERMSRNAHRLAKEQFDLDVIGKRLVEQIEIIIDQ